jgi:hypothetical protein
VRQLVDFFCRRRAHVTTHTVNNNSGARGGSKNNFDVEAPEKLMSSNPRASTDTFIRANLSLFCSNRATDKSFGWRRARTNSAVQGVDLMTIFIASNGL